MSPTTRPVPRLLVGVLLTVLALVGAGCGNDDGGESTATVPADGSALPQLPDRGDDPAVGMEIPEVSGRTITGDEITIAPDGAKVMVFLAHWCPHCQAEVPRIVEHLKTTPMPDDVELVGVATATKPSAPFPLPAEWLADEGWTAPTLDDTDNTVAAMYGLSSFPYFVVVDADGAVVARASGEITTDQFDQLVAAASSGSL